MSPAVRQSHQGVPLPTTPCTVAVCCMSPNVLKDLHCPLCNALRRPTIGVPLPTALALRVSEGSTLPTHARGVVRPEGGESGCVSAQLAVGAGCSRTVGGYVAHPLHAAGPHTGDRVHMPCHRGVHHSLVRPHQGACHVVEGPPGPEHHDGVGVVGVALAPAGGERGSSTGASRLIAVAWWVTSRFPLFPSFRRYQHSYAQRAHYTHNPPVYLYPWVDIPAIAFW